MSPFLWCPFCCGGDIRCNAVSEGLYSAFCPNCGANGPQADNEKEATELWNKRWIDESGKNTEKPDFSTEKPSFSWELNDEGMPIRLRDGQGNELLFVTRKYEGEPFICNHTPDIFVRIARLPRLEKAAELIEKADLILGKFMSINPEDVDNDWVTSAYVEIGKFWYDEIVRFQMLAVAGNKIGEANAD